MLPECKKQDPPPEREFEVDRQRRARKGRNGDDWRGPGGHLGVDAPVLAIFAVDTGGGPRAMVGPVARAYETWSKARLDDRAARKLPATVKQAPWTARFLIAAPPRPTFTIDWQEEHKALEIVAPRALGAATLELLDHHRVAKRRIVRTLPAGRTRVRESRNLASAAARLGMAPVSLARWIGRRTLPMHIER